MAYSTYLIKSSLNLVWGAESFVIPTNFHMFLSTTDPGVDGTGRTEPVGAGYVQLVKTNNTTNFPSILVSPKLNGVDFNFAPASGSWGTIAYAGFDDQAGNFLGAGELPLHRLIGAGDILSFPAGAISITMS